MIRNPCVCNDEEGMHDKDTRVCTQRRCACLKFTPILARQGTTRLQEIQRVAADHMNRRATYKERQRQQVLKND